MSLKPLIQNLEDTELIRLFLDFAQTYRLQYEKLSKEISYKCYEATWILATTKATGYGRTESEAYKHALRNLLEMLVQLPTYTNFFIEAMNTSTVIVPRVSLKKEMVKTEGEEDKPSQDKDKDKDKDKENRIKTYDSYSKLHQMSTKKNPCTVLPRKEKRETHHSKICLNRSVHTGEASEELIIARNKLKELENRLETVCAENRVLKERLGSCYAKNTINQSQSQLKTEQHGNARSVVNNETRVVMANIVKGNERVSVPKLKLEILPNYHKKSEKSLNEGLLAAYNEKHGERKVQ